MVSCTKKGVSAKVSPVTGDIYCTTFEPLLIFEIHLDDVTFISSFEFWFSCRAFLYCGSGTFTDELLLLYLSLCYCFICWGHNRIKASLLKFYGSSRARAHKEMNRKGAGLTVGFVYRLVGVCLFSVCVTSFTVMWLRLRPTDTKAALFDLLSLCVCQVC